MLKFFNVAAIGVTILVTSVCATTAEPLRLVSAKNSDALPGCFAKGLSGATCSRSSRLQLAQTCSAGYKFCRTPLGKTCCAPSDQVGCYCP